MASCQVKEVEFLSVVKGKGGLLETKVTTLQRQAIRPTLEDPLHDSPSVTDRGRSRNCWALTGSKTCRWCWHRTVWGSLWVVACLGQNCGTALQTRGSSVAPFVISFVIIFQILARGKAFPCWGAHSLSHTHLSVWLL